MGRTNGCHNAERKPGYLARDGLTVETARINGEVVNRAAYRMVYVEDVMSRECRYDFRASDELCRGCGK